MTHSVRRERMEENFDIFDLELSDEEHARIATLDTDESLCFSHYDAESAAWLSSVPTD